MKKNLLISFLVLSAAHIHCQTIDHPNYGLKTHPTLDIESIVATPEATTFNMVIENRSLDGTFCADKNIYLELSSGKKLKIKEALNIPRCPDVHAFKTYGEKLYFTLTFPPVPSGEKWLNLVERCDESCFSFNHVILDKELNKKIDNAYSLVDKSKNEEAIKEFENLLADISGKNSGYEGAIYLNIINLCIKSGNQQKAEEWTQKLNESNISLKEKYIESLKNQ